MTPRGPARLRGRARGRISEHLEEPGGVFLPMTYSLAIFIVTVPLEKNWLHSQLMGKSFL